MTLFDSLRDDHKRVRDLVKLIQGREDRKVNERAIELLRQELQLHTHLEESLLYPQCGKHPELKAMVDRSIRDHGRVRALLERLGAGYVPGGENTPLNELIDCVEQHVREEEDHFFPIMQKVLGQAELQRLERDLDMARLRATTRAYGQGIS